MDCLPNYVAVVERWPLLELRLQFFTLPISSVICKVKCLRKKPVNQDTIKEVKSNGCRDVCYNIIYFNVLVWFLHPEIKKQMFISRFQSCTAMAVHGWYASPVLEVYTQADCALYNKISSTDGHYFNPPLPLTSSVNLRVLYSQLHTRSIPSILRIAFYHEAL